MKDIDSKDLPGVSGGYSPEQGDCFPPFPGPDYPQVPLGPFPEPLSGPPRPGEDVIF